VVRFDNEEWFARDGTVRKTFEFVEEEEDPWTTMYPPLIELKSPGVRTPFGGRLRLTQDICFTLVIYA
jgi:hypothetical protein